MKKQDWHGRTFTLTWLRSQQHDRQGSVFAWLRDIGVVPVGDARNVNPSQVQPILVDPNAITARYLAAFALEWDADGPASPRQFLDALELETAGTTARDVIGETLEALGRAIAEEREQEVTYRLRLPH